MFNAGRFENGVGFESLESRQLFTVGVPTPADQLLVELINRARANPTLEATRLGISLNSGLLPNTISSTPKQPLALSVSLLAAAEAHSQWMIDHDVISHTGANGTNPLDRMTGAGLSQAGLLDWAENLASSPLPAGTSIADTVAGQYASLFTDAGVLGRGHRLNILDPELDEVGTSSLEGLLGLTNSLVTTTDFAGDSGRAILTGVAFDDSVVPDAFYTIGEGLGGLTVTATRLSDGLVSSTQTLPTGGYALPLDPGAYDLTLSGGTLAGPIVVPSIMVGTDNVKVDFTPPTVPPNPSPTPTPTPVPSPTPVPIPDPQPTNNSGTIRGKVFQDANRDGRRQGAEGALGGIRVYLDLTDNSELDLDEPATLTSTDGSYEFDNLAPGDYIVRVDTGLRWHISGNRDAFATGSYLTSISSGETEDVQPIGLVAADSTTGFVFLDVNGDGARGPKEKGLKKRRVFADVNDDGVWQASEPSSVTNKLGGWSIAGLPDGDYVIRIEPKAKYVSTTNGGVVNLTVLLNGGTVSNFQFGEQKVRPIRHRPASTTQARIADAKVSARLSP